VHDHGSYEWHCLYVHSDSNERVRYWCRVDRFCCSHALDGSGCAHWCVREFECEWSVGCFVDGTFQQWWCGDHGLHSDPVCFDNRADTGVVCVGESVHDLGSYEWHRVHVHGDGDERVGYWCCFNCFRECDSVDGSGCAHWCVREFECEWSVGCVLDCPIERWRGDHWVHGDPVCFDDCADSGVVCPGESVHDLGSHEWHCVYVHGDGDERVRYWRRVDRFCCSHALDGSWCTDLGFGEQ